jgi:hypothetical protein
MAETGAALHFGGASAELVDDAHLQAYNRIISATHSNRTGPTFVHCRELDIQHLTAP